MRNQTKAKKEQTRCEFSEWHSNANAPIKYRYIFDYVVCVCVRWVFFITLLNMIRGGESIVKAVIIQFSNGWSNGSKNLQNILIVHKYGSFYSLPFFFCSSSIHALFTIGQSMLWPFLLFFIFDHISRIYLPTKSACVWQHEWKKNLHAKHSNKTWRSIWLVSSQFEWQKWNIYRRKRSKTRWMRECQWHKQ